jgi:hypothetical protein
VDAVLIQSARAAGIVAERVKGSPQARRLLAFAISQAAAAPLADCGLAAVRIAPRPTEAALLALIGPAS